MTQEESPRFAHGARWVRADFHLHTVKEPGQSRKKYRAEFRDREDDFPKEFIARLKEEKVGVGVVTNHNHFDFDEFKCLRKRAAKEDILLLPGLELGIKEGRGGIHTLIVFNPENWLPAKENTDFISRFLSGQFTSTPDEGTRTKHDLCGVLRSLDDFGYDYFVIFAHCQTDNGFFNELDGGAIAPLIERCGKHWQERVLGFQRVKMREGIKHIWPKGTPFPASVDGSDPENFEQVARQNDPCFLKIGELSFDAVKFALHDHGQRVLTGSEPPTVNAPYLSEIRYEGGRLGGQTYPLSEQLSCLIGSRGSGKSSVIEALRFALGIEPGSDDARYKNGLVEAVLQNGGEVIVKGIGIDGSPITIQRALGYEPRVSVDGKETKLQPSDVFPGILYFGQKDLGNRHEDFEEEFFSQLLGRRTSAEFEAEAQLVTIVKNTVESWNKTRTARKHEQSYRDEAERLKDTLDIYRKHGIEKQLEQLTQFDTDKRNLADLIEKYEGRLAELEEQPEDWKELAEDWLVFKSKSLTALSGVISELKPRLVKNNEAFQSVAEEYHSILTKLKKCRAELQEVEKEQQEKFIELQREVNAPEGLNLQQFRTQKARLEQLEKLLKASKDTKSASSQALQSVEEVAVKLHDYRHAQHRTEQEALKEKAANLPDDLKLTLRFEAGREDFRDFLAGLVSGKSVRRKTLELIVETCDNGLVMFQKRKELWDTLGGGADKEKIREAMVENLAGLLTFKVPDHREILCNDASIKDLSLGQRATALLQLLMSVDGHPLFIIDQPEDDLDNETIFRNVVEPLLEKKRNAQFLIATHNPNIPVLGDAELVHACQTSRGEHEQPSSGSLDSAVTRDAIVAIMEGGQRAFDKRQQVYQQWTNTL